MGSEADVTVEHLESELAAAKQAGDPTGDLKLLLREARARAREQRTGTVNPSTIGVKADLTEEQ